MTPERIAELRALADAATSGPWRVRWFPVDTVTGEGGDYVVEAGDINGHAEELICYGDWDGDFIAAARTAVPELLAEVERLEARVADLTDEIVNCDRAELEAERDEAVADLRRAIEGGGEAS